MLLAQTLFTHLACTRTLALAAASPALQLFTRVDLYRNRRLLELSQPSITQTLHVLFLHLGFLKNLPHDLSPVLPAPNYQDFILKRTQVHLSLTVHLLRCMEGKVYYLVDVTLVTKSPWSMYLLNFTSYFFSVFMRIILVAANQRSSLCIVLTRA